MDMDKSQFLYSQIRYRGQANPENLIFNSKLQEFAIRVNYICNLETNGKISAKAAYEEIESLWKQLEKSRNKL